MSGNTNKQPSRFRLWLQRRMQGRYGTDKLNMTILIVGLVMSLVSAFIDLPWLNLVLTLGAYILMGIAIFRTFSKNIYKRYHENQKFLLFFQKLTDRKHKYFHCPRCRQQVRVPKGKGRIAITCPKCKEKFIEKT